MNSMKHLTLALVLMLPTPVLAQQDGEIDEGFSLMEEGARLMFRGLMGEMEPTIEDFSGLAQELQPALDMLASEMGPALMELMQTLDSVRYYQAPEVLPNGDIIIRRRPDAPEFAPLPDNEVIDL